MRQRPVYEKLQKLTKEWSLEQIEALDFRTLLKEGKLTKQDMADSGCMRNGIKRCLEKDFLAAARDSRIDFEKNKLVLAGDT